MAYDRDIDKIKPKKKGPYLPLRRFRKTIPPCDKVCASGQKTKRGEREGDDNMEFEGTVKLKLVHPLVTQKYYWYKLSGSLYLLAYMLMGMITMNVYYFTLRFYHHYSLNLHVFFCGAGFYFLLPVAYILRDKAALHGIYLTSVGRNSESIMLRMLGLISICAGYGIFLEWSFVMGYDFNCAHSTTGFLAFGCALTEAVLHGTKMMCLGTVGYLSNTVRGILRIIVMINAVLCHRELVKRPRYRFAWTRPEVADLLQNLIIYVCLVAVIRDIIETISAFFYGMQRLQCKFYNKIKPKCADPCIHTMAESLEHYDNLLRADV